MSRTAPYGTWPSQLTPELLVAGAKGLSELQIDGDRVCWLESRPSEAGRQAIMQRDAAGRITELTPPDANARTRVHEYGGGSYLAAAGVVWFTDHADQRIYRLEPVTGDGDPGPARAISPVPSEPAALRYTELQLSPDGRWIVCVRERHDGPTADDVHNEIVVLPADGAGDDEVRVLCRGRDFYAAPRLHPDGTSLAFIAWDHPNMPWDDTELVVCDVREDGDGLLQASEPRSIAGGSGAGESLLAPAWSPDGVLHVISDRSGWWNLHRVDDDGLHNLAEVAVELGAPHWQFGASLYGFLDDGRIVVIATEQAVSRPSVLDPVAGTVAPLPVPHTSVRTLATRGNAVLYLGGSPTHPDALIHLDVAAAADAGAGAEGDGEAWEELYVSRELPVDATWLSEPEAISFPTSDGMVAHAWLHRPRNPEVGGPADERPPLIVTTHGGPTGHVAPRVELGIAYWTSRGFAVVDVNYRGSTSFGRAYRNALRGTWGVYDVDDCVAVVAALAEQDEIDPARAVIRGGSAGGFTTLAALTFRDTFAGGASYYGVGDLGALAEETHKFESRYLDGLVGPYPDAEALYRERSPVHHAEQLSCPIILLQGMLDKVVPPAQAEDMIAAMTERGIPYAYVTFDDEDHGFRRAKNVVRALEAELSFYAQLFGLAIADHIEHVEVVGLDR